MAAILEKTTTKIKVVNSGCIKCHKGPRSVCLYCAAKSRLMNIHKRSRYCHTSLRLISSRFDLGLMTKSQCSSCKLILGSWISSGWIIFLECVLANACRGVFLSQNTAPNRCGNHNHTHHNHNSHILGNCHIQFVLLRH